MCDEKKEKERRNGECRGRFSSMGRMGRLAGRELDDMI